MVQVHLSKGILNEIDAIALQGRSGITQIDSSNMNVLLSYVSPRSINLESEGGIKKDHHVLPSER